MAAIQWRSWRSRLSWRLRRQVRVNAQGSPRGKEYDTLSGVYAEFLDQEVLPRVEMETATKLADQAVTFTKDPEGRGTLGGSSGGIASFIAARTR